MRSHGENIFGRLRKRPHIFYWARICKPFKEPRNRFPAWRADTTTLFVIWARVCNCLQTRALMLSNRVHLPPLASYHSNLLIYFYVSPFFFSLCHKYKKLYIYRVWVSSNTVYSPLRSALYGWLLVSKALIRYFLDSTVTNQTTFLFKPLHGSNRKREQFCNDACFTPLGLLSIFILILFFRLNLLYSNIKD